MPKLIATLPPAPTTPPASPYLRQIVTDAYTGKSIVTDILCSSTAQSADIFTRLVARTSVIWPA